jgi:hypothetical protein
MSAEPVTSGETNNILCFMKNTPVYPVFSPPLDSMSIDELKTYIKNIVDVLNGSSIKMVSKMIYGAYDAQITFTPEYYRLQEEKRLAVGPEVRKALKRPGFILIGWYHPKRSPGSIGTDEPIQAIWLPETGDRHPYWDWSWQRVGNKNGWAQYDLSLDLMIPHCSYKQSLEKASQQLREGVANCTPYNDGIGGELIAIHLLDKGPDRRAAFLRRRAEEGDETHTILKFPPESMALRKP